jgi:hypothetical protein
MATILPAARTGWDVLGEHVGAGMQRAMPQMYENQKRQMGLNAIDQLQQDLKNANGDMSKMIPALAKAYTLNPSLERSGIAEKLIPLAQRKEMPPAGVGGASEGPRTTPTGHPLKAAEGEQPETPLAVADLVPPRPGMIQDPQGLSQFQLPYGPEDVANIRNQARSRGLMPEIEERMVNDALEYNNIAEQRRKVELGNYAQAQQQRIDTRENQQAFEKYLSDHSPEFSKNPDELELALKSSEKYQNVPSFAERNAKVKNELRPYQAAKEQLKKALERPIFGLSPQRQKMLSDSAQFMVKEGQKPQLQLMIANGGHGEIEEANLLNRLPDNITDRLNKFPTVFNPLNSINVTADDPKFDEQLEKANSHLNKIKSKITNDLRDIIKPGKSYNEPGTNLLLVRKHLMDKNATWEDAGTMIFDAVRDGKIKLDPQQQIDYQKLNLPPLTGQDYFDTVMNNIMFPITGRE